MKYSFKFKWYKRVKMFKERQMGVVIERERHVVCVYGTDSNYDILCAVPLCHPKYLKDVEYMVSFFDNDKVRISAGDFQIVIDYANKKVSNNMNLKCYGSDKWGRKDIQAEWGTI